MKTSILTDVQANTVYFSSLIKPYTCFKELKPLLERFEIPYHFVSNTADLWVRDFMPVQLTEDCYCQFVYRPDYLADLQSYQTDPQRCTPGLPFSSRIQLCDIVVDGGNVIKCDDRVIMTDKVFRENKSLSRNEVISRLEKAMECEILFIPHDPNEKTGHADGMVRFIGNDTVLLNHYIDFDEDLRSRLLRALSPKFEVAELCHGTSKNILTSWAYLNYMQVGSKYFVPAFQNKLDDFAFRQLEDILQTEVHPVYARSVVKLGGALNCLSWTVKE